MTPEQAYYEIEFHCLKVEPTNWKNYRWHAVRLRNRQVCHGWGKTLAGAVSECVGNIEKVDKR